jgi:adenylate cyclase
MKSVHSKKPRHHRSRWSSWVKHNFKLNIKLDFYALGLTAAFVLAFFLIDLPHGPEHWSADLRTAYLSQRLPSQHPRIALIYVSSKTLDQYPYVSPVDRQLLADLVDRIDAAGAKAIGLDFIFDRPTEANKDNNLLQSIQRARAQIVLGAIDTRTLLADRARKFQDGFLKQAKRPVGHLYFDEDHDVLVISDGIVRFMAQPSSAQPARKSFAELLTEVEGSYPLPSTPYISWLLPPKNGAETFLSLTAEQVLGRENPAIQLPLTNLLGGKIVLVGGNFTDRDQHLTPLSVVSEERFTGLSIHAQILAQLLSRRSVYALSWSMELVIFIVAALAGIWFGRRDRSGRGHYLIELAGVVALIAVNAAAFYFFSLIFPITLTLLSLLAGATYGHYSRHSFE